MFRLLIHCLGVIFFCSCSNKSIYSSYIDFENGWGLNDTVFFKFNEIPNNKFDIKFLIRNDNYYEFSNLFLIASLNEDGNLITKDTLEYLMADKQGNLLGTGYGNIRESFLIWINDFNFKNESNYLITLNHAMRKNKEEKGLKILPGIISVGINISKKQLEHE